MGYEQEVEVADRLVLRVEETHTGEFGTKRDLVSSKSLCSIEARLKLA